MPALSHNTVLWVGPSNLGPYHLARYNSLSQAGWDVHVLACSMYEYTRPWSFDEDTAEFQIHRLPKVNKNTFLSVRRTISTLLKSISPSIVVFIGYGALPINMIAIECRLRGIPRVLNIIGNPAQYIPVAPVNRFAKKIICKTLYPAALVPGSRGRMLGRELGIDNARIFEVGNMVDVDHFWADSKVPSAEPHFLYLGRISPEKNLPRLVEAYRQYRITGGTWGLRIVGDGPELQSVTALVRGMSGVSIPGWTDYEALPGILRASSALILPSLTETWGLVLNEALAARTPVIVSQQCGAYPELCIEGVNGFGIIPTDVRSITDALHNMSDLSSSQRSRMGIAGQEIISSYTWSQWTSNVRSVLSSEVTTQRGRSR